MTKLLICPSERTGVHFLSETAPLVKVPLLGQGLIEYWLSWMACSGAKHALILAHDRPEEILALVGNGARWGMELQVINESRELTPAQALLKYAAEFGPVPPSDAISLLDHFPGQPEHSLFTDYAALFAALSQWMANAITPDRVGMREWRSGVWVGTDSHIAAEAQLRPPCWIGRHAFVGPRAVVGPDVIVEDGAFVEPAAEVAGTCIGPDTFVGQHARIVDSFAWRDTLINWRTGSLVKVPDPFLLCALRQPRGRRTAGWFTKMADLYARNKEDVALICKHLLLRKEG
jgi:NDP-sugar pyrophosphorylase family protein